MRVKITGFEAEKPTFNAYLREFHGIGRQEEGETNDERRTEEKNR